MSAEQLIMPRNKKSYTSLTAVIEKLERMNLDAMAEQLKEMDKSGELTSKSPLEVLDQLISFQSVENQNNTTERYKKKAKLYSPLADLQDLLYIPSRHINAALVDQLATNQYIDNSRNVMITSATGCGKTFLACALGNNACEHQYTVRYFTMAELLEGFRIAEARGKYVKFLRQLANTYLIIIDDFLLTSVTDRDVEYLYRLVDSKPLRNHPRSFIICSQLMKDEMYTRLGVRSTSLADAIINRLVSKAYDLEIQGDSMREMDITAELERIRAAQTIK
jgi:DNA replication protein DnaC